MTVKIGSRESPLAVKQSHIIMDMITTAQPHLTLELHTMKTTGDIILDRTLDKIGGKGLFVKELELALLEKRVDITVHSCKDIPMEVSSQLPLLAFGKREDPRDVLVLPEGVQALDMSKPIGCSSQRRALQLASIFPQAQVKPIRGNVQTRLAKLETGEYSALVLAAAGLKRLDLDHRISRYFTTEEMLPAGGQGILVVQGRDEEHPYLDSIDDPESRGCALAERRFVAELEGGCSSPVAAFAQVIQGRLYLQGMNAQGEKDSLWGELEQAIDMGADLAKRLKGEAL